MTEKKFATVRGAEVPQEAAADYEAAQVFDKLRVGKLGVYYKEGFKTKFIPYAYIDRAFIRIQEVRGRMCCGETTFAYYRLVFVHSGKEFADIISEQEETMDQALACIHEAAPAVAIGFVA